MLETRPKLVLVPGLSGAPWDVQQMTPLAAWDAVTVEFPENLHPVEQHADVVCKQTTGIGPFVVAGDGFGAAVGLTLAVRRPRHLKGLVISWGGAANPAAPIGSRVALTHVRFLPEWLYRPLALRFHARWVASAYDFNGEVPWSPRKTRKLFAERTSKTTYVERAEAAFTVRFHNLLSRVRVPVLVISPSDRRLVDARLARAIAGSLPEVHQKALPNTGPMFRFSHPVSYGWAFRSFLEDRVMSRAPPS